MKPVLLVLAALLATSCATPPKEPVKQYAMRGEVTELDPQRQVATIKHEDIKGFMHAMTMEYGVHEKTEFAKLHPGDKIDATLFVQGDDYWIGQIKPAAAVPTQATPTKATPAK
jgi:protein SCO1/2